MTTDDLIEKLKEMRAAARWGDNMTAMTQLFGIIFDKGIENSGSNTVAIGRRAGVGGEVTPIRPTSRGRCAAMRSGRGCSAPWPWKWIPATASSPRFRWCRSRRCRLRNRRR